MELTPSNYKTAYTVKVGSKVHDIKFTFKNVWIMLSTKMSYEELFNIYVPTAKNKMSAEDKQNFIDSLHEPLMGNNKAYKKTTDLIQDYTYIWDSFYSQRSIDLNKDDLLWWEFTTLLKGLMLEGRCSYSKVLGYRTYEKASGSQKAQQAKEHSRRMELKREYALDVSDEERKQFVNNGIHSMAQYLKAYQANRDKVK